MKLNIKDGVNYIDHDKKTMSIESFEKWVVIKKIIDTYRTKGSDFEYVYKETDGIAEIIGVKIVDGVPFNKLSQWIKELGWTEIKVEKL